MIRDELHPEDLLARAARQGRPLGAEEEADLRAHVERCPACALQLSLRGEVRRALAPTAADAEIAARAVQRLLAAGAAQVRVAPRTGALLVARLALIGLMLVGTGVGAAVLFQRAREGRRWGGREDAPAAAPARTAKPRARAQARDVAKVEPPPATPEATTRPASPTRAAETVVATPTPPPSDLSLALSRGTAIGAPDREAPLPGRASPRRLEPEASDVPVAAPVEAAPPRATEPPAPTETPARVFQAAERARRSGDATEADRLYGQLATDFPRSREEIAARALHGQLLLDELGRAEEALAWFDAYLRAAPRGALAEEARAGRAEAFGRLARRDEEAAAWSDLLASHPGSLHGARARARLAALARE